MILNYIPYKVVSEYLWTGLPWWKQNVCTNYFDYIYSPVNSHHTGTANNCEFIKNTGNLGVCGFVTSVRPNGLIDAPHILKIMLVVFIGAFQGMLREILPMKGVPPFMWDHSQL